MTPVEAILLEPAARNTSAAAALAAAWLVERGSDELMLLMPSDHLIGDTGAFLRRSEPAFRMPKPGSIVTFGAKPTEPNTQYGYIEADTAAVLRDGAVTDRERSSKSPTPKKPRNMSKAAASSGTRGIFLMKAARCSTKCASSCPKASTP